MTLKFINKYLVGFEKAYLTRVCPAIRIRESRRIMGGKAVSTDRDSYLRFLQITVVTGQAAGAAAALAARDGLTPRELEQDVSGLQAALRSQGAILDGVS